MYLHECSATQLLARSEKRSVEFDKDDEDAMDFVTSAANLRAHIFNIPLQTKFASKCIHFIHFNSFLLLLISFTSITCNIITTKFTSK